MPQASNSNTKINQRKSELITSNILLSNLHSKIRPDKSITPCAGSFQIEKPLLWFVSHELRFRYLQVAARQLAELAAKSPQGSSRHGRIPQSNCAYFRWQRQLLLSSTLYSKWTQSGCLGKSLPSCRAFIIGSKQGHQS